MDCPPDSTKWPPYKMDGPDDYAAFKLYQDAKKKLGRLVSEPEDETTVEDYRLVDFDSNFASDTEQYFLELKNYVKKAQKYMAKLRRASLLRHEHYVHFIRNLCKREEDGHRAFRTALRDVIVPESQKLFDYWKAKLDVKVGIREKEMFDKPQPTVVYAAEPAPYMDVPATDASKPLKTELIKMSKAEMLKRKQIRNKVMRREKEKAQQAEIDALNTAWGETQNAIATFQKRLLVAPKPLDEEFKKLYAEVLQINMNFGGDQSSIQLTRRRYLLTQKQLYMCYDVLFKPYFVYSDRYSDEFLKERYFAIRKFNYQHAGIGENYTAIVPVCEFIKKLDNFRIWLDSRPSNYLVMASLSQGCFTFQNMTALFSSVKRSIVQNRKKALQAVTAAEHNCAEYFVVARYELTGKAMERLATRLERLNDKEQARTDCAAIFAQFAYIQAMYHLHMDDIPKMYRSRMSDHGRDLEKKYLKARKKVDKFCLQQQGAPVVGCSVCGTLTWWKDKQLDLPLCSINCYQKILLQQK